MLGRMVVAAPRATDPRLLSPSGRRWATGVGAVAAVVVLILAVCFAGSRSLPALDEHLMVRIYAWYPDRQALAHRVSDLGGSVVVFLVVAGIVAWAYVRRRPRVIALAIISPTVAIVLTEYVLKPAVHRRLLGYVTYPSGHSTGAFSVATLLAVVLLGPGHRTRLRARVGAVVALFAVCVLVAISLVAAAYHVPTDTLGGAGVAIATVLLVAVAIDAVADRRARGATADGSRLRS
jgi:undecaprenyl-diphosphatase